MRVAAVQFAPSFTISTESSARDIQLTNFNRLQTLLGSNPADFYVLPELCLEGYSFMGASEANQVAQDVSKMGSGFRLTLDWFQELSISLNAPIVFGFVRKEGGELFNSQMMVFPQEQRPVVYDKANSFANDHLWATPGYDRPKVVDWTHIRPLGPRTQTSATFTIGGLICRDICNESKADEELYQKDEVDIVAFSANWGAGGFPAASWVEFAKDQNCWLVVANRYGTERNNDFGFGGSCIISPSGKVHCGGLKFKEDCVISFNIEPDAEYQRRRSFSKSR